MPIGRNRVLGDPRVSAANRPHHVGLAGWPASIEDTRTRTFDALTAHAAGAGYEGLEVGISSMAARYFPGDSMPVAARKMRRDLEAAGLRFVGSTLHTPDEDVRRLHWLDPLVEQMKLIQDAGGEFASVQFSLHPDYINTGGAYRDDEDYLRWCADRVACMRDAAWDLGLNFYLETHMDRITEDPAACCRILEMATCEVNGDLSHYLFRGITHGPHIEKITALVGHTHIRMARRFGDLSAGVDDPGADWAQKGVTWQMFDLMKRALDGGLSSRAIIGETGPMHLVVDTLTLDAALVPLYRAMARYADASAQGIAMKVDSPEDLRPWV